MPDRGRQTEAPRMGLPLGTGRAMSIVWGMSFGIASIFAVGHILTVLALAPAAIDHYEGAASVPAIISLFTALGPIGIAVLLTVVDLSLYGLFAWLGRRYWIGFAYVPPVLYLGLGTVVLWMMAGEALMAAVFRS